MVDVQVNNSSGIAIVTMQRPPVNSLNLELVSELTAAIDQIESNKSRGFILTSVCICVPAILDGYKYNLKI